MSCPSSDDWPYNTFFNHQFPSPQQFNSINPSYNLNYHDPKSMMTITDSIITTSSYGTDITPTSQLSTSAMISSTSPSSSAASSKQVKKRSRGSKKTPTTLVNADATNFRSLVQQFTGCPTTPSSLMSAGPYKGPLNINFAPENDDEIVGVEDCLNSNSKNMAFGFTGSNNNNNGYVYGSSNIHQQQTGFSYQNRASDDGHLAGSYMGSYDRISSDIIDDCCNGGGSLSVEDYFDWGITGSSTTFDHDDFN